MRMSLLGFVISITVLSAACSDKVSSPLSPSALSPSFSPTTAGAAANGSVGSGVTAPVVGAGPIDEPEPPGDSHDEEATKQEIEGLVEALPPAAPGTLVVAGRTVTTDATTMIRKGDATKIFADLAIGQRVHVKGRSDGTAILATLIEIQNTQTDAPVNLNGIMEGVTGSAPAFQLTIEGRLVKGDHLTEYFGEGNRAWSFTDLKNGSRVEVKGQQRDGYVYAARIHIEKGEDPSPDEPASFQGTLTAMTGTAPNLTLTVGSKAVRTSADTLIERKGERWSFGDLRIGYLLHVEGTRRADGSIDARKIQVKDNETSVTTELEGVVGALTGACPSLSFVVNGTPVVTNASTVFAGGCASLRNGDKVGVKGTKQPDGAVLATKVQSETQDVSASIQGTLTAMTGAASSPTLTVGGTAVRTSAETSVERKGDRWTLGDLRIGYLLHVEGTRQADGSIDARKIQIKDNDYTTSVEVEGVIAGLAGVCPTLTFTVNGTAIVTNASTVFTGGCGTVKNAVKAQIKGTKQPDGAVLASKVKVEGQSESTDAAYEGKGYVGSLAGSCPSLSFTLSLSSVVPGTSSVSVHTNGSTVFDGASCGALKNGAKVEVKGTKQSDATVLASKVEVHEIPSTSTSFEGKGTISGLSGSCPSVSFTLSLSSVVPGTSSVSVSTNGSTKFSGVGCDGLKNGLKVFVKGTKGSDGKVTAAKIEKS